jgi:hypothetical protein
MNRSYRLQLTALCLCALIAPQLAAVEYEGQADGVWINVDTIDIVSYSEGDYYEYLGKGYVVLLERIKAEGLILDYGVMQKMTGSEGEGDMVIWWSTKALGDFEKVFKRFEELSAEVFTGPEWQDMWKQLDKVRKIRSTNIYREVTWTEMGAEE